MSWLAATSSITLTGAATPPRLAFPSAILWQIELSAAPSASAAYDDTSAYLVLRNGDLTAVSHIDGQVRWSVSANATVGPFSTGTGIVLAQASTVFAVDRESGKRQWERNLDAPVAVPATGDDSRLLVVTTSGTVVSLDPASGSQRWATRIGAPIRVVPSIENGRAAVSVEDGRVVLLALSDGRVLWERRLGGSPGEPVANGDRVFVGAQDNYFYCLSIANGGVKWRWRTGGDIVGRALVDARNVYFLSLDNLLRCAHRRGGNIRWSAPLPSRPIGSAVPAGDLVLVATVSSQLAAFEVKDGRPAGSMLIPARLYEPPHLAMDTTLSNPPRLIVLTADGQLQAVGKPVEPPVSPLNFVPGTALAPETLAPVVRRA